MVRSPFQTSIPIASQDMMTPAFLPLSRFRILLSLLLALVPFSDVKAQTDSVLYITPTQLEPEGKGEVRLNFDNLTFVRDNEYKGLLVKGYTLPGMWLEPTLSYQPLRHLKVEAGLHMLHYWGANKYPNLNYSDISSWKGGQTQKGFHCVPIFRAQAQLSPEVKLVLGTIYGKQNHGLIQPLYNEELNLSADPEAGLQVLWDCRPLWLDAWINWESFIFRNDNHQESFTFGLSTRFRPSCRDACVQCYLPLQTIFQHRGGEINTDASDRSIKTWFNAATGVGLNIPLRTKFPVHLNFEADVAAYRQQAGTALPFDQGLGFCVKASARLSDFTIGAGYWQCHNFISIFGNPLLGTLSVDDRATTYRNPRTFTGQFEYAKRLGHGFSWGMQCMVFATLPADAYNAQQGWKRQPTGVSLAAGAFLRIHPSFLLKRL